jgi:hypothetical protein
VTEVTGSWGKANWKCGLVCVVGRGIWPVVFDGARTARCVPIHMASESIHTVPVIDPSKHKNQLGTPEAAIEPIGFPAPEESSVDTLPHDRDPARLRSVVQAGDPPQFFVIVGKVVFWSRISTRPSGSESREFRPAGERSEVRILQTGRGFIT